MDHMSSCNRHSWPWRVLWAAFWKGFGALLRGRDDVGWSIERDSCLGLPFWDESCCRRQRFPLYDLMRLLILVHARSEKPCKTQVFFSVFGRTATQFGSLWQFFSRCVWRRSVEAAALGIWSVSESHLHVFRNLYWLPSVVANYVLQVSVLGALFGTPWWSLGSFLESI